MNKVSSVVKLILSLFCRVLGLTCAFVALDFLKDRNIATAGVSLTIGVVLFFLPDLIRKKMGN